MKQYTLLYNVVLCLVCLTARLVYSEPKAPSALPISDSTFLSRKTVQKDSLGIAPEKAASDSLKKSIEPASVPVKQKDSASLAETPLDTTYCFWNYHHFGIGMGWSLGSFPLFDEWIKGLPDSSRFIAGSALEVKNFSIKEPSDAYNILWPINIWWAAYTSERHALCIEGSFFWLTKNYQAYLQNDSNSSWIHWQQSLSAYSFSLGLNYKFAIPEQFFNVENSNRTSLLLGFSAIPLLLVNKSASFSSTEIADSTLAKAQSVLDNSSMHGIGCAWKAGFSSLHRLSAASALEISVVYIGRWYGSFTSAHKNITAQSINPKASNPNQKLSFISSTFELSFALVSGKKPAVQTKKMQ